MKILRAATAAAILLALVGCTPTPSRSPSEPSASAEATFTSVIDGDTIRTSAGTVRLIGIDTPERGECGHVEASAAILHVAALGDILTLELPAGQNDVDRHGRMLRFVMTADGTDLGLRQLQEGHAVARYDSRDGYPEHPREAEYHAAQRANRDANGTVVTTSCRAVGVAPALPPTPTPSATSPATDAWWQQYSSCAKLKKNTAGHPTGPFRRDDPSDAEIYAWFAHGTGNNGDGDSDGLACEG